VKSRESGGIQSPDTRESPLLPAFPVHIFPFRMTADRLAKAAGSPWEAFWKNLRQGYDAFEKSHVPPDPSVRDGWYRFR